ncbi:MAG: hypothetical protein Q8M08_14615 [Bacteroidales bacterium]|nr:hypothetical protein [Bacteroidales bacterium]
MKCNPAGRAIVVLSMLLIMPFWVTAQSPQEEEVLLAFRHPAVGNLYVGSIYDYGNEQVFLPVTELFSLLEINYQPDIKNFTVTGNFITPGNPYTINLSAMQVTLGANTFPITPDDFRIGAMDFYLSPRVYEKIFGLNFTANIFHLTLVLETTHSLPVQERKARERERSRQGGSKIQQEDFPMGYPRKRAILGGAMVDYSVTGNFAAKAQNLGYNFTGGMEALGGDIQGSISGSHSSDGFNYFSTSGLRWRYVLLNNNYLSSITAGQVNTTGLQSIAIKGVALSNDPIEPRRMYENYVIDGTSEPESEVELYINERLSDYKRADELGYYRFDVPVTYGTTRLSLRIFTPSGELRVIDRQMQVPFTFLPRGVVSYNVQAGVADQSSALTGQDQIVAHGNVGVGISRWLTASAGVQHAGNNFVPEDLFYYGSLSGRIARQYLMNLDIAPNAFYRLTGSVIYTNNMSFNLMYTKFDGASLFNSRGAKEEFSVNIYLPFTIFGLNTGLRIGGEHTVLETNRITNYRADLSARLGRVNLRFNYRDNFISSGKSNYFGLGLLTTSLTYTIARMPGIPVYVRGMFIRGQVQYDVRGNLLQSGDLQLSRTVFKTGRINLGASHNFLNNTVNAQFGFTFDLNQFRSATTINSSNNYVSARQSFTGSVGIDAANRHIDLTNRQQAGRSSAAVVQYVDNNNSGAYDAGDQLLPYRGVTLDRTTVARVGRDSILRLSQLQSYYKYNLSVNRNAIADPTLVPLKNEFSFIADPNRYKRIEIPFYRGGIINGMVLIERDGNRYGQGGLRLLVKGQSNSFEQTIRTFSDGGFYSMDLPPGTYTLNVDPAQLGFLNAKQSQPLEFEIKALSEGDFLEGLEIILVADQDQD